MGGFISLNAFKKNFSKLQLCETATDPNCGFEQAEYFKTTAVPQFGAAKKFHEQEYINFPVLLRRHHGTSYSAFL